MQHVPTMPGQLVQAGADGLLAGGADPPPSFGGLQVQGAGDECPEPAALPHRGQLGVGLRARRLTGHIEGQVVPPLLGDRWAGGVL